MHISACIVMHLHYNAIAMKERKKQDAQITFRIDAESYDKLTALADNEYRRLSDYLRLIVQKHISEKGLPDGKKIAA
jgi:hypothetical protein